MDNLPSKVDLKRVIANGIQSTSEETDLPKPVDNSSMKKDTHPEDLFKKDLWSDKSKRLYDMVDKTAMSQDRRPGSKFNFRAIHGLNLGTQIGLKNTLMSSQLFPGTLERFCSDWCFSDLRFIVKEVLRCL